MFHDLCYCWLHRAGHESAVFWAAHVVHHQSQNYNLSTALRQTSSGALLGWIFYVPMAIAGVPPLVFGIVALIDLLYQFWVHTEHIQKLGWFDRWFCSPSNHRVHHAVNEQYLDRNYGGILIVWDRMFSSFIEESERCVYGTRSPLNSWDPLWSNIEVYWSLLQKSWHTPRWGDKLRFWIKPPGWQPHDTPAPLPGTAFNIATVQLYHPPAGPLVMWFAAMQFMALLAGAAVFLWFADGLPLAQSALWVGTLTAAMWATGALMQGRIGMLEALMVDAAALATATSAAGLVEMHHVFKPLTMLIAMFFVAKGARFTGARSAFFALLLAALACSMAGDVFLMFPGHFIAGLVSCMVAHLFYIALFRQGVGWFPGRPALMATLAVGVLVYAALWASLPRALRGPVGAYMVVIALMVAQALGRVTVLRDKASLWVAIGACFFMLSDTLLATNRFAIALPMAQTLVLSTYYTAQILMARHARPPA